MTGNSLPEKEFELKYQIGKLAFEQGRYRVSIQNLHQAEKLVSPYSRLGEEVKMWLINAYQALGDSQKAIELCHELMTHPRSKTKQQAQRLLYIIQAPKLQRPSEWMTQIPEMQLSDDNPQKYQPITKKNKQPKPKRQIELVDMSTVNNQDNNFIWLTLLLSFFTLFGLLFF